MSHKGRILIAGGSGFIGEYLRRLFISHYYEVYILSTRKQLISQDHVLYWSPTSGEIDLKGVNRFDAVINLAGAGVADKIWTRKRKEELLNSRVDSTTFLKTLINQDKLEVGYFVQASAIGIYGNRGYDKLSEDAAKGDGFLANLTLQWEKSIQGLKIPFSIIRIGVVFHPTIGAFPKLIMGLRFRFMIVFGNGRQYISWIDVQDLCEMIYFLFVRKEIGVFNAVSPQPVQFIYLLKKYNSKFGGISIPIMVPSVLLKWIIGDLSEMFLYSQKVCSRKLENLGFSFKSKTLSQFLKHNKKKL